MPARQKKKTRSRRSWLLPALAVVILGGIWATEQFAQVQSAPTWMQFLFAATQPTGGLQVGLMAGHAGNDSGAVCPGGLTEAEVNLDVAQRTAERLRAQGIRVEILEEYDARLRGYRADALVSIHADSCSVVHTGFKVAHQEGASEASQRLTECLWEKYEAATGLARHLQTITPDMTRYHAFNRIAVNTPSAIIELGFLNADGALLTQEPGRAAQGVADGIICFLAGSSNQQ
jgi:N-acetylmuramoyl-L-alanine amidase